VGVRGPSELKARDTGYSSGRLAGQLPGRQPVGRHASAIHQPGQRCRL